MGTTHTECHPHRARLFPKNVPSSGLAQMRNAHELITDKLPGGRGWTALHVATMALRVCAFVALAIAAIIEGAFDQADVVVPEMIPVRSPRPLRLGSAPLCPAPSDQGLKRRL